MRERKRGPPLSHPLFSLYFLFSIPSLSLSSLFFLSLVLFACVPLPFFTDEQNTEERREAARREKKIVVEECHDNGGGGRREPKRRLQRRRRLLLLLLLCR